MNDEIQKKLNEIEHYHGVLERYRHNRWYWQGRRHLDELEQELSNLRIIHGESLSKID